MQIKDAKVGDRIKIPFNGSSFINSQSLLDNGEFLTVTVIHEYIDGGLIIAWDDERYVNGRYNLNTDPFLKKYVDDKLRKKFAKLQWAYHIIPESPCELIKTTQADAKTVGFLLACIGAGAGLSAFAAPSSKSNQAMKSVAIN